MDKKDTLTSEMYEGESKMEAVELELKVNKEIGKHHPSTGNLSSSKSLLASSDGEKLSNWVMGSCSSQRS